MRILQKKIQKTKHVVRKTPQKTPQNTTTKSKTFNNNNTIRTIRKTMTQPTIQIRNYNNTSRKGDYLYIKIKGKRAGIYKYTTTLIDPYIQYYKDHINNQTKGTIEDYKKVYETPTKKQNKLHKKYKPLITQAQQYTQQIKKTKNIQQHLKKGITQTTIPNVLTATQETINKAKQKLLEPLVLDKQILQIITTPQNFNKLQHRIEYKLNVKNEKEETLGTTNKFNDNPENIIHQTKQIIKKDESIKKSETSKIQRKLENNGWNKYEHKKDGYIETVSLTLIFRKNK